MSLVEWCLLIIAIIVGLPIIGFLLALFFWVLAIAIAWLKLKLVGKK